MGEEYEEMIKKFNSPAKAYIKEEDGKKVLTIDGEEELEEGTDVLVTFSARVPSDKYNNLFIGKYKGVEKGKVVNGEQTYDFLFDNVLHSKPILQERFIKEHEGEGTDQTTYVKKVSSSQLESDQYRIYHTISSTRNLALLAASEELPIEVASLVGSMLTGKSSKISKHKAYSEEAQAEARKSTTSTPGGRRKTKKRLSKKRRHTSRK